MIKAKINKNKQKNRNKNNFFERWKRQIRYAWANVFSHFYQHILASLLTIIVLAISIALPTIGYILWKNVNEAAQEWYPAPNLTVYISNTVDKDHTTLLLDKLKSDPDVLTVSYLSTSDALKEFKEWSGFSGALDLLSENPLPAVAIVEPKEYAKSDFKLKELQLRFSTMSGIDDVRLDNSWFTRLTALTGMVKTIICVIAIFMISAVSLVIANSIRLNIFARRETIIVMQLIGATEGFILRPFLYNGLFVGFISALFALALSEIFILAIESIILNVSSIFGTMFIIKSLSLDESLLLILITMIIGWLSAFIATKNYLKIAQIN